MNLTAGRPAIRCIAALMLIGSAIVSATPKGVTAPMIPVQQRQAAPNFALEDAAGTTVRLSDYRGRVVLLDFWATKCGGCVEEIPWFIEIANAFGPEGLATVGVSEDIAYENLQGPDEAWALVRPFVRDRRIPYTVLMGDRHVTASYAITALPLTYLVDAQGRVAAVYNGLVDQSDLKTNLRMLLAERRR